MSMVGRACTASYAIMWCSYEHARVVFRASCVRNRVCFTNCHALQQLYDGMRIKCKSDDILGMFVDM